MLIFTILIVSLSYLGYYGKIPFFTIETTISISSFISFISLIISILVNSHDTFTTTINEPYLFSPEQFAECFDIMVEKTLDKDKKKYLLEHEKFYNPFIEKIVLVIDNVRFYLTNFAYKLFSDMKTFLKNDNENITSNTLDKEKKYLEQSIEKIVFVIDNIDRCPANIVYNLFSDIKTFLKDDNKDIIFIIPVDEKALKKHFHEELKLDKKQNDIDEFLRKFFDAVIRLKPIQTKEISDFVYNINEINELNYNSDTLDVIAEEFAESPRRIIQLFNNLAVELNTHKEEFRNSNETLICKYLIIREEFPNVYNKLSEMNINEINTSNSEDITDEEYNNFNTFNLRTSFVESNSDEESINKIVSNFEYYFGIPKEISKAIRDNDSNNVLKKYITKNDNNKSKFIHYMRTEIKEKDKKDKKSILANRINLLIKFHDIIDKNEFISLQKYIESTFALSIQNRKNMLDMIKFSKFIDDKYLIYLFHNYLENNDLSDEFDQSILKDIVIIFKNDCEVLNMFKNIFHSYYELTYSDDEDPLDFLFAHLNKGDMKCIINKESIELLISNLKVDKENNGFKCIEILLKESNFGFKEKLLLKIEEDLKNYPNKDYVKLLDTLTELFSHWNFKEIPEIYQSILNPKINNILAIFYNTMFNKKKNQSTIAIVNNAIKDSGLNLKVKNRFTKLIFEIYPFYDNIHIYFDKLDNTKIFECLEYIIKKNIHLNINIQKFILKNHEYDDNNKSLILYVLTEERKKYKIQDNHIKNFINECVIEKSNLGDKYLLKFKDNERVKKSFENILKDEDYENILSYGEDLRIFSYELISEGDIIPNFENDLDKKMELLKSLAKEASIEPISKLKDLLIILVGKNNIDKAIEIIMCLKTIEKSDGEKLIEKLEKIANGKYASEIKEAIEHISEIKI